MDFVLTAVLQEIAIEGLEGCTLQKLWTMVQTAGVGPELITNKRMKQLLWLELLKIPGMVLMLPNSETVLNDKPDIQSVDAAESSGLRLIAPEGLRESSLGMYDLRVCDARLSKEQRNVLECIAKSRTKGITQSQLSKEFKIPGNKMFYLVKMLEVRGLVVRQATLMRNLQGAGDGTKPIVATNLLHLTRYAKDATKSSSHQRLDSLGANDVSSIDREVADMGEESSKTEFIIKDDMPAMQAVCEKLEETDGKVLVVSDIKTSLGYRMAVGHRTWRRIVKRLQDAGLVEILSAQVEQKVRNCIRLVRPFDKRAFNVASDEAEAELPLKCAKRGQVTDLVTELSIDQQIYRLVDRSGPHGVQMIEVFNSLGLQNKRNYYRISTMLERRVLVSEAENHKRSTLYRLKTLKNLNSHSGRSTSGPQNNQNFQAEGQDLAVVPVSSDSLNEDVEGRRFSEDLGRRGDAGLQKKARGSARKALQEARSLKGKEKGLHFEEETEIADGDAGADANLDLPLVGKGALVPFASSTQRTSLLHTESGVQVSLTTTDFKEAEPHFPVTTPLSTTRAQREKRILEKLQAEKFILRVELHKWLEEQENRKNIMMDRKTLSRMLQSLQASGHCKCIMLSMPGLTNCGRQRTIEVVLYPSINIDPELLSKIHDQVRKFDMTARGHGVSRPKKAKGSVPILMGVPRMVSENSKRVAKFSDKSNEGGRSMQSTGFIPAKMVRVRMLHHYLWKFVSSLSDDGKELPDGFETSKNMVGSCRIFVLANAVQAMPLELFLQIVGSMRALEHGPQWCKQGLRLRDLPDDDRLALLDSNATGRLSWLVDVLRRLKLVRLVMGGEIAAQLHQEGLRRSSLSAVLTYAVEHEPYLEEPASHPLHSMRLDSSDTAPRFRHEFRIATKDGLDDYWQNLEYFYSGAQPAVARHSFPGSSVPELFGLRSWASVRVMSVEQRTELLKRVGDGGLEKRKPWHECVVIARELNLSLQQVLRVSYEKNRVFRLQNLRKAGASPKKRGSLTEDVAEPPHVRAYKRQKARADNLRTSESGRQDAANVSDRPMSADEADGDDEENNADFDIGGQALNDFSFPGRGRPSRPRARRFTWSEDLDRKLFSVYAIRRAQLGALFQRVDWDVLKDLPAPPKACRRRMGYLRMDPGVRKALSSLCSFLSIRYTNHMPARAERSTVENDALDRAYGSDMDSPAGVRTLNVETRKLPGDGQAEQQDLDQANELESFKDGSSAEEGSQEYEWNDFRETFLAAAMDEVMRCSTAVKANAGLRGNTSINKQAAANSTIAVGSGAQEILRVDTSLARDLNADTDTEAPDPPLSRPMSNLDDEDVPDAPLVSEESIAQLSSLAHGRSLVAAGPTRRLRKQAPTSLRRRLRRVLRAADEQQIRDSSSLANAVELVKLVLLNSGTETPVASTLVDAVGRFKETEIVTAVKYLRDRGFLVLGQGGQNFVLSTKFLHDCSASRFPVETSDECSGIAQWFSDHAKDLEEDWVTLPPEPGSGQLSHLLALVSTDEFSLNPKLPPNDIGETVAKMKRRSRAYEVRDPDAQNLKARKVEQKLSQGSASRRERGFAGIEVLVTQSRQPLATIVSKFRAGSDDAAGPSFKELLMMDPGEQSDKELDTADASGLPDVDDGRKAGTSGRIVDRTGMCDELENTSGASPGHHRSLSSPEGDSRDGAVDVDDLSGNVSKALADCIRHWSSESRRVSAEREEPFRITSKNLQTVYNAAQEAGGEGVLLDVLASKLHGSGTDGQYDLETAEIIVQALGAFGLVKQVNGFDNVRVFESSLSSCFFLKVPNHSNVGVPRRSSDGNLTRQLDTQGPQTLAVVSSDLDPSVARNSANLSSQILRAGSTVPSEGPPGSIDHRIIPLRQDEDLDDNNDYVPILPWLDPKGDVNEPVLKGFVRRVMGLIALHPGISEDLLVEEVNVLHPQSVRQLIQLLVLDGNLTVKAVEEPVGETPPNLLLGFIGASSATQSHSICVRRYFVNALAGPLL